jgi:methyl-accepting chemotaxis protein
MENTQLREWSESLALAVNELSSLNSTSEADFLSIGAHLSGLADRAGRITERAASAATILHGEEMNTSIAHFRDIISEMERHLSSTQKGLEAASKVLREILLHIHDAEPSISEFKSIVRRLKAFGISAKIESTRIPQTDLGEEFQTIAEGVESLSGHITSKSALILSRLLSLRSSIETAVSLFIKRENLKGNVAGEVLEAIGLHLTSLENKYRSSTAAASVMQIKYKEIEDSVREIVGSLQFHDITRQQIEHVMELLLSQTEFMSSLCEQEGTEEYPEQKERLSLLPDIIELQVRQLSNSQHEILSAIDVIIKSLGEGATGVAAVTDEVVTLVNTRSGSLFLTELRDGVSSILASLSHDVRAKEALSSAMESIVETMNGVSSFVTDIEDIDAEIELIALNAQVKSTRTGSAGAALGVIAEAIRLLSDKARDRTSVVSQALQGVHSQAVTLSKGIPSLMDKELVDKMVGNIEAVLTSLGAINERMSSSIQDIESEATALNLEIQNIIQSITIHEYANRILKTVTHRLKKMVPEMRKCVPRVGEEKKTSLLNEAEARYTMHRERSIHKGLHAGQGPRTAEDLGDNIELF